MKLSTYPLTRLAVVMTLVLLVSRVRGQGLPMTFNATASLTTDRLVAHAPPVNPTEVPIVGLQVFANAEEDPTGRYRIGGVRFTRSTTVGEMVINFTIGGSATNGTDYVSLPTSVTFAEGVSLTTLVVDPLDDTVVEGTETVVLTLQDGPDYDVDPAETRATLTITDEDRAPAPPVVVNPITSLETTVGQVFSFVVPNNDPWSGVFADPNGDLLTLSVSGLPPGLRFEGTTNLISGTATTPGTSTVTLTATDSGGLSASTHFSFTVKSAVSAPTTAPTFGGLPASGTACVGQSLTLTAACASGTVQWLGQPQGYLNGASIVVPITAGTFNYSAVCTNGSVTGPAATTRLTRIETAAPNYATGAGQSSLTVTQHSGQVILTTSNCSGQLSWTSSANTKGTGTIVVDTRATGTFSYTATCQQNGCISPATVVSVTVKAGTLKLERPTYNCGTGELTLRTTGGTGGAIEYQIPSVTNGWEAKTTYTVDPKRRDKTLKLRARQWSAAGAGWVEVAIDFTPSVVCSASGRLSSAKLEPELSVVVLGNPVLGNQLEVEIRGAEGQRLQFQVSDVQGRPVLGRLVEQATRLERQSLRLSRPPTGPLYLRVSTDQQAVTVKLLTP